MKGTTSNPVPIHAISLEGIGPYLKQDHMDLKPLTVLCGENGAGKSTWFKSLDLLRRSVSADSFPFQLLGRDWDDSSRGIEYCNAAHRYVSSVPPQQESAETILGSPCTIRLYLTITADHEIRNGPKTIPTGVRYESLPHRAIWYGRLAADSSVQLRISHPHNGGFVAAGEVSELFHVVELVLDDRFRIFAGQRAQAEYCDPETGEPGYLTPDEPYQFWCDPAFLPSGQPSGPLVCLGSSERLDEIGRALWDAFINLFRELALLAMKGTHQIGAIRQPHDYTVGGFAGRAAGDERQIAVHDRDVGSNGQHAWLLRSHYARNLMRQPGDGSEYTTELFIRSWLFQLLGTRLDPLDASGLWERGTEPVVASPDGLMVDPDLRQKTMDGSTSDGPYAGPQPGYRYSHVNAWVPFYGEWTEASFTETLPAALMSSGFHQLFPIIVQAAVMREHDTLAIENPEAHLHPSLQLKVADFLIAMAKSGRHIAIETHSDLIVQRILRRIIAEDLPQAAVQIYFVEIHTERGVRGRLEGLDYVCEESVFACSKLTPIHIDDSGRVANWPRGFMDDAVEESRRMLETMYGGTRPSDADADDAADSAPDEQ